MPENRPMITIPLTPIHEAMSCDRSTLDSVDLTTEEEREGFTRQEWNDYAKGYYNKTLLPTLGEPRYYSRRVRSPVIPLAGKRYRVNITFEDWDEPYESKGKYLIFEETDEPETPSDCPPPERGWRGCHYWQVFGQPNWIQGEYFPVGPDGKPCSLLLTQENGWGDSGNWNILVSLDEDGLPAVAYFEASCC